MYAPRRVQGRLVAQPHLGSAGSFLRPKGGTLPPPGHSDVTSQDPCGPELSQSRAGPPAGQPTLCASSSRQAARSVAQQVLALSIALHINVGTFIKIMDLANVMNGYRNSLVRGIYMVLMHHTRWLPGERSDFTLERADCHHLSPGISLHIPMMGQADILCGSMKCPAFPVNKRMEGVS